jgi:hypothetical protein
MDKFSKLPLGKVLPKLEHVPLASISTKSAAGSSPFDPSASVLSVLNFCSIHQCNVKAGAAGAPGFFLDKSDLSKRTPG